MAWSPVGARGLFASSFVAGSLLAAAVLAPQAWEPLPDPIEEPLKPEQPLATEEGLEAAIAISMRAVESNDPPAERPKRPPERLASRPDIDVRIVLPPTAEAENTVRV